jgi:hypothetical protein
MAVGLRSAKFSHHVGQGPRSQSCFPQPPSGKGSGGKGWIFFTKWWLRKPQRRPRVSGYWKPFTFCDESDDPHPRDVVLQGTEGPILKQDRAFLAQEALPDLGDVGIQFFPQGHGEGDLENSFTENRGRMYFTP